MATQIGLRKWLRVLLECRSTTDHVFCSLKKKYLNFQSVLKVQPGRRRPEHAKDWSIENTKMIDWGRLNPFMKKHTKALEGYIGETFQ